MIPGYQTQDLLHEGRALTDCAILAPYSINGQKETFPKTSWFSFTKYYIIIFFFIYFYVDCHSRIYTCIIIDFEQQNF